MLMAKLFQELERHGKKNFEVVYLVMNPGYNDWNYKTICSNAQILNVPITVFESEIFDIVAGEEGIALLICAHECAAVICTVRQRSLDAIKSRWGIILMM